MRTLFSGRERLGLFVGAIVMLAGLLALEIFKDDDPFTVADVVSELLHLSLLVGCTVFCALFSLRMRAQEEESLLLRQDLQAVRARSEQWRQEQAGRFHELGAAIQAQLQAWGLTPAEQDVALLLLKGFSHKEIARLRTTGEATIRQQATSIYQKADLGGRAGLSAYFLEELLLPVAPPAREPSYREAAPREPTPRDAAHRGRRDRIGA